MFIRLAGAVVADERNALPRGHLEVDPSSATTSPYVLRNPRTASTGGLDIGQAYLAVPGKGWTHPVA
jgi:hypothetical protein